MWALGEVFFSPSLGLQKNLCHSPRVGLTSPEKSGRPAKGGAFTILLYGVSFPTNVRPLWYVSSMTKTTSPEFLTAHLDELEYAMTNANFVTRTLVCDYCPVEWEIDAPADWTPSGDLTCEACHDEWFSWGSSEDSYLDSYWESMYE